MATSRVGMMRGFLVVSAVVMLGRFTVMVGSVGMMFRGVPMMFSCFFRHEYDLCYRFSVAENAAPAISNRPRTMSCGP
jgi:phosphatidylserine synthase